MEIEGYDDRKCNKRYKLEVRKCFYFLVRTSEGWKNLYPCISICLKLIRHGTWVVLRNV